MKVDIRHQATLTGIHAFAEFHKYVDLSNGDLSGSDLCERTTVGDVHKLVESKLQPTNPWYRGMQIDINLDDSEQFATTTFHFNSANRNWNYSGCSDDNSLHSLRILVFKQVGISMEVIVLHCQR